MSLYLSTLVSGGSLFFTTNGSAEEKYLTYLFPLGYINVTPFSPSLTSVPFGILKKLLSATDICCNSLLWYIDLPFLYRLPFTISSSVYGFLRFCDVFCPHNLLFSFLLLFSPFREFFLFCMPYSTPLTSPRARLHIEDRRFSFAVTVWFTYNFYVPMIFTDNCAFRIIYDISFTISAARLHCQTHNGRNFYKCHKTPLPERDFSRSGLPIIILLFSLPACPSERLPPRRVAHEYFELNIRD